MALDKQKILNELGNVVNQLQSADCGCMGKLFSNNCNQPNQNGNFQNAPMGVAGHDGYMQGSCHGHGCGNSCHGYNAPGAGEPGSGNRNCMGYCNPPKLYADTYNYLNHSLMQPVVKEVYNDLKSMTPDNTIMNSPAAAQMGLLQGNNANSAGAMGGQVGNMVPNQIPGGTMGNQNAMAHHHHGPNVRFGNPEMTNTNNTMQMSNPNTHQQMGQMAQPVPGMGPNILNMMMGDAASKRGGNPNPVGTQGGYNNAQQSYGSGQYNNMGMNNVGQGNPNTPMQKPISQYMSQPPNMRETNANMQGNTMNGNMNQMNPGSQQMQSMSQHPAQLQGNVRNPYVQHNAGIAKFNEMFPGVMNGGDLGFDPMAIAIQMNPANQQKAAMDTMQKMMMSNGEGGNRVNSSLLQPVINATNAALANVAQPNQQSANTAPTPMQQQIPGGNAAAVPAQNNQVLQQQVHPAPTGDPTMNEQLQYKGQYQQMVDPNKAALATVYEDSADPNARQEGSPPTGSAPPTTQQMVKEPILPADTSRNIPPAYMHLKHQEKYNTLGQPVEMLPADIYRSPEPPLPQTLSPQSIARSEAGKYSNVKATFSKTSIMGNRPVGKTPSKGQLQQIYNQYKGSQSFTQQNIRTPDNGASYSEGHLNVSHANANRQAPIEKVGGDSANKTINNTNNPAYTAEVKPGQVGDVPVANKPQADADKAPVNNSKVRNGLQDQTFTAYTSSAAWSFHGATPAPYSAGYQFRYKV